MIDILIIGAGPAGMSAGIYGARAGYETVILEGMFAGGEISKTSMLENYLGFQNGVEGIEFSMASREQTIQSGAKMITDLVEKVELTGSTKKVTGKSGEVYEAKTVILAMGAEPRSLGIENEKKFEGRGVSYCATCDGALYKGKQVAVIGGGDTALEDAHYLSKFAQKVTIVHRRNEFRGQKVLEQRCRTKENIEFCLNKVPQKIEGDQVVSSLVVQDVATKETQKLEVQGIFLAVGYVPNTKWLEGAVACNDYGYIIAGEDTKTNIPGVFVAGDVRTKKLRQVATAVADGAVAASEAAEYISSGAAQ